MPVPLRSLRALAPAALLLGALGCTASSRSSQVTPNEPPPAAPAPAPVSARPTLDGIQVQATGTSEGFMADATVVVEVPEDIEGLTLIAIPKGAAGFVPQDKNDEAHTSWRAHTRAEQSEDPEDGTHVLSLYPLPGPYVLVARAPGYQPLITSPFVVEQNTAYRITGLRLTPGEVVAGHVDLPEGASSSMVELEGNGYRLRQETTDGRFRFDTLTPGTYTVRVRIPRHGVTTARYTAGREGGEVIATAEGRCFTGTVKAQGACVSCARLYAVNEAELKVSPELDPAGPLPGAVFIDAMARESLVADTDEQGRFRFCFMDKKGKTSVLAESESRGLLIEDLRPGEHTLELQPLVAVPYRVKGKPKGNVSRALMLTLRDPWSTTRRYELGRGKGKLYVFPGLSYELDVPVGMKLLGRVPKNVKLGTWGAPRRRD
ncbi:MAG TPA: hypothetical protein VE153_20185 [Myxococcus sp.]|nr:hypothetical protein [Myxococcus sp.]